MSNHPKPSFVISQSNFSLFWFGATNQFLVVSDYLEVFFSKALVQTQSEYQEALEGFMRINPDVKVIIQAISIDNINTLVKDVPLADCKLIQLNDFEVSNFTMGQHTVSVYYDSKTLQTLFEAPFAYLKQNFSKSNKVLIITKKVNQLSLFNAKKLVYTVPKDKFFVLQAQFTNQLTEYYHSIFNPRWLCSFHACAVQKNNKTFLILGDSGAGKSTLCSLLSLSDYRFIADDLVLMCHDFKIYDNPAAVSVKENAWPIVERYYKEFNNIKTSEKTKGQNKMKFLPLHALQNNMPQSFHLDSLVWVNYSTDRINRLSQLDKQQALSRLIPDTWINPKLTSVKAFANWAIEVKTYHLDYHDFHTAKKLLDAQLS